MYLVSKWQFTKKCYKMLPVSHSVHQTIGKNLIKPLKSGDCGCMRRKAKVVAVHVMTAYGAVEVKLHSFYTSALAGDKWSASSRTSTNS